MTPNQEPVQGETAPVPRDLQELYADCLADDSRASRTTTSGFLLDLINRLAKSEAWANKLSAELDKGDSWAWIRGKFEKCRTQFKWHTPRTDSLVGTRYEVMGWLHVLFAHADPQVYIDITMEHQKKTDDALEKLAQAEQRAAKAEAENAQWRTWGIVEIAVRNPSVAEYVAHWEERATKAEQQVARLSAPVSDHEWKAQGFKGNQEHWRSTFDDLLAARVSASRKEEPNA